MMRAASSFGVGLIVALGLAQSVHAQTTPDAPEPSPAQSPEPTTAPPAPAAVDMAAAEEPAPEPKANNDEQGTASTELSADEAALLAALDAQSESGDELLEAGEPRGLDIYGFMDFTFSRYFLKKGSLWRTQVYDKSAFSIGNINVYLDADIGEGWRSLAEVRFTYLPNGDRTINGVDVERTDTSVLDYTSFGLTSRVGGVILERAWLQYTAHSLFSVRAGNWLTPYGVWNVDHGSPTIIPIVVPYSLNLELIPQHQTGIQVFGTKSISDEFLAGYHFGISNGRGPVDDYADLDENKALTARAFAEYFGLGHLRLGASMYYGDDTSTRKRIESVGDQFIVSDIVEREVAELGYALDVRWVYEGFHAQAEFVTVDRVFSDRGRPTHNATSFVPDNRLLSTYGLIGYRTKWLNTMPYIGAEYFTFINTFEPTRPPDNDVALTLSAGLNSRPTPAVTLKLQYIRGEFPGAPEDSALHDSIDLINAQAAWAF